MKHPPTGASCSKNRRTSANARFRPCTIQLGDYQHRERQDASRTNKNGLATIHAQQAADLAQLQQLHREADERYRVRLDLEQDVQKVQEIEADNHSRKMNWSSCWPIEKLSAKFCGAGAGVRTARLGGHRTPTGDRSEGSDPCVANADNLAYRTLLTEGLKGARVRNHDEILDSLLQLRPEQLAQYIQTDDQVAFDEACGFGVERTRKILDAFRENVDPLELEVVDIEDQVRIELNVATINEPIFKDAAELSRGQKCTLCFRCCCADRQPIDH